MDRPIIIGTRGSDLALWQANTVKKQLEKAGHTVSLRIITTKGDKIQDLSFDKIEGKGFFTKEIEEELLSGSIDLAVHSHKDLETTQPAGLCIAAVSKRENPADLLVIRPGAIDDTQPFRLAANAVVGTSSARRKNQLIDQCPQVRLEDIRGNVPTRIKKLREGYFDAILLARAGVKRLDLDLSDLVEVEMDPRKFIPAPAQGVLALQIRAADHQLHDILQPFHHTDVHECIGVERKILSLFQGGCQLPLGAFCARENGRLAVYVAHAESWNTVPAYLRLEQEGAEDLAIKAAEQIRAKKKSMS